jgi:hypothetical protein
MPYLLENNCFLLSVAAMRLEIFNLNYFLPNCLRYAAIIDVHNRLSAGYSSGSATMCRGTYPKTL